MEGIEGIYQALRVYRGLVNESLRDAVGAGVSVAERRGIFSTAVVVWLMIFQRLNPDHSLAAAVDQLRSGQLDDLLEQGSYSARAQRISGFTGGFAKARERISLELVKKTVDGIGEALEKTHRSSSPGGQRVYVVDGSTSRTAYTPKNIEAYPQYHNQHGKAHFPLIRFGIATNAVTGVVMRPAYGPYSGEKATDELRLAEELFTRIPSGAILIGDRYYGCARFADMAQRSGHNVIVRVKEGNAKKFIGASKSSSGELAIEWNSTKSRGGECYSASGRFIWHTVRRKGFRDTRLVLFTTSNLPRQEIVKLYALRWNVELDLRDIKSTLEMDMLYSKTPAMGAKELILGIAAYNLIRHIVVASAKSLKLTPRELSFSRVLKRMHAISAGIYDTGISSQSARAFSFLLSDLKSFKLPKRKTVRPLEPRKVWQKGNVNFMIKSRQSERKILNNQE
jgi:hypothetical protein